MGDEQPVQAEKACGIDDAAIEGQQDRDSERVGQIFHAAPAGESFTPNYAGPNDSGKVPGTKSSFVFGSGRQKAPARTGALRETLKKFAVPESIPTYFAVAAMKSASCWL
ncbi:hypothetical protein BN961_02402 [Afipia felis]|uniref:Uncharacterized protein n=1 Tax=Afipia felis TaxID=1035 RepID=A0A090MNM6_AFIFE|nr:hypothetical protein BN961_02402 [Afipia felis]